VQINTLQNVQNVFIAPAAKCQQCSGQGSARVRLGSNRVFSPYLWGRSDDRLADPCQTMRQGFEPADVAAPCDNPLGGPLFGTVPTGAPVMVYD